jgi:hypothetical protein
LLLHPATIAYFSRIHRQKEQFFLCASIPYPLILTVNHLILYQYIAETNFGTDIANYFRIQRPPDG